MDRAAVTVNAGGVLLFFILLFSSITLGAGPYPVRVGPDHRHLVDQNGAPFLI